MAWFPEFETPEYQERLKENIKGEVESWGQYCEERGEIQSGCEAYAGAGKGEKSHSESGREREIDSTPNPGQGLCQMRKGRDVYHPAGLRGVRALQPE